MSRAAHLFTLLLVLGVWDRALAAERSLAAAEVALNEGIVAFNHEDYGEAITQFQESLKRTDRGVARYWLGLALLRSGRAQEAIQMLEASLAGPQAIEKELRPDVLAALQTARQGISDPAAPAQLREVEPSREAGFAPIDRRPVWEGSLSFASGFDSNPNLLPEELSLTPAPGQEPVSGKDSDTVAGLDLRGAWHGPERLGGWNLQANAAGRRSFHEEMDFLDYSEAAATVHFARGEDPDGALAGPLGSARVPFGSSRRVAGLLQARGSYSALGDDPFLRTVEAAGSLTFRARNATSTSEKAPRVLAATRIALHVQDRSFSGVHQARSGEQMAAELAESVRLLGSGIEIRLSVLAGDRNAGESFSESFLETGAEVVLPLSRRWNLRLAGGWRKDDFEHRASNLFQPVTGEPRLDETLRGEAVVTWEIGARLRGTVRAGYTRRESNLQLGPFTDLGYRRTTAVLGLGWFL